MPHGSGLGYRECESGLAGAWRGGLVAISPDVVEYVRTLVRDDHEANDQIEVRFGDGKWGEAVASFMSAVFFYAMDLRFQGKCDDRSILAFVAELRSQTRNSRWTQRWQNGSLLPPSTMARACRNPRGAWRNSDSRRVQSPIGSQPV